MKLRLLPSYLADGRTVIRKKGFSSILRFDTFLDDIREARSTHARYRNSAFRLKRLDFSATDLAKNREIVSSFSNLSGFKIGTVNWFVPHFSQIFGGVFTILRFAEYFARKSIANTFVICGETDTSGADMGGIKQRIVKSFPNLSWADVISLEEGKENDLPEADISIATQWETAYSLLKFNKTIGKFYFIQDYEPLFYPADVNFGLAEATYRFGFRGITNTMGLCERYRRCYGGVAEYFTPSVDKQIFYPDDKEFEHPAEKPFVMFFYARPNIPRNGFDLGLTALRIIKKKHGERVRIYTAGGTWDPGAYDLVGKIENLGILPYEKTADLYRKCDLGLVFMFTEHPSFLPFEFMACGCPVVTNYNPATTWFFKDGENCLLAEPTVTAVCEKIELLMKNVDLHRRLVQNGLDLIRSTDWETEMEKIYRFVCKSAETAREPE